MDNSNTLTSLKRLPLELRDRVYDEATDPLEIFEHPEWNKATILEYFGSLLPQRLQRDPQIASEATMALLRQTLQTATTIKVPRPEYIDPVKSSCMQWGGVRHLEFTRIQHTYASFPTSGTSAQLTVRDIVSRCHNLENLTFSISSNMMLKPMAPDTNLGHWQDSDCKYMLRIMEHSKIRQLVLNYNEGGGYFFDYKLPSTDDFKPFVKNFQEEANLRGRYIELKVDLSPGIVPRGHEQSRSYKNGFTWVVLHGFFG